MNIQQIQQMMKQAQQMQERLQKQMAELRVEGNAGGGMVTVVVNGAKQVQSLKIDPEVVSKDDVEMLQDLIVAAINDAHRKADEADGAEDGRHAAARPEDCDRAMSLNFDSTSVDVPPRLRSSDSSRSCSACPASGRRARSVSRFTSCKTPREQTDRLVDALRDVKERVTYCSVCNNITDVDPCAFCSNDARDHHVICVVEEPQNVTAIEKTREFKGVYHVLMGALSPLQGIGPDDLKIKGLLARVGDGVTEVILATNPNVEGEATAIYLARLLKPLGVKVTRIAMGVPVGSDLEYADEVTMHKALEGRREV